MVRLAREQRALYVLERNVSRNDLPVAEQLKYDRRKADQQRRAAAVTGLLPQGVIMSTVS